ncbi:MAG: glucuronate isomerase [Lachnospiraceae bacterium]|nr:glucuronate isomerase [Lachnospiraceae bacterium]
MNFLTEDFLLSNDIAKKLYHEYAETMPIIDYHCHIPAEAIALNRPFKNITELWLGGDHYKWRYMRSCGVDEKYITGDASDKEKFTAWIRVLETAVGNPLYHWSHLELNRYFGFDGYVKKSDADALWDMCNEKLAGMTPRSIIESSDVKLLCTTDDPADSLEFHEVLGGDDSFTVKVLPAFRPDNAMNLLSPTYTDYIVALESASGRTIDSFKSLCDVLSNRMDYFNDHGCVLADHGLVTVVSAPAGEDEIENIFGKRLAGEIPSQSDFAKFQTAFLRFVHKEYVRLDWTSQLHYGCKRDNNSAMFASIGANTGFDCIEGSTSASALADFLNMLNSDNALPRMIVYSLNPVENAAIDTVIGCFQDSSAAGRLQHGSAWWFNDNKPGMLAQLTSLASLGNLSVFVGMLTDSRSFVSYTRHEYFRRILCDFLGKLVSDGEFPEDYEILGKIVRGVSYENAKNYFGFDI